MAAKENSDTSGGFGWNEAVDPTNQGSDFVILPEGEAFFTVTKLERTRKEFGKFGTINVAIISLMVTSADVDADTPVEVKEQIGLHRDLEWKITQFFTALGHRKHGDTGKFVPDWSKIVNESGRCVIQHRKYAKRTDAPGVQSGTSNDIKEFIAPEEENATTTRF
jgi:hypothetical protein